MSKPKNILSLFILCCIFSFGTNEKIYGQYLDTLKIKSAAIINLKQINNKQNQFSPAFAKDGIVYVEYQQKRKSKGLTNREKAFDIMFVNMSKDVQQPEIFNERFNSNYVEGPASFSADFKTLYLTRSNIQSGELKKSSDKILRLKIFKSTLEDSTWSDLKEESFILGDYNYCHPSISEDGETLIIASDMPGGFGKMDLYLLRKIGDGWSAPTNLGPAVNSAGNDWFPFLHQSDILFYASDGYFKEKQDLDIYAIDIGVGNLGEREKLPSPINSEYDDFGLILNGDQTEAYFSSSRLGGKGRDDIYQFKFSGSIIEKEKVDSFFVQFVIKNEKDNLPLEMAKITMSQLSFAGQKIKLSDYDLKLIDSKDGSKEVVVKLNNDDQLASALLTDVNGTSSVELPSKSRFLVEVNKEGFQSNSFIYIPQNGESYEVLLEEIIIPSSSTLPNIPTPKQEIFIPTAKGSIVVFENIYYDLNSANLKAGAVKELDALSKVMQEQPYIKVQLSAHTDSRGNDVYNQLLSDKRATSAKNYLISKGISSNRIVAIGFGESRLRNRCSDEVPCTEEEHQYNRRTEVKILDN